MCAEKKRKYASRAAYTCTACKTRKKKCDRKEQKNEMEGCSFCKCRRLNCSLASNGADAENITSQLHDLQSHMQSLTNLLIGYKHGDNSTKFDIPLPSANASTGSLPSPSTGGTLASAQPLREYFGKDSIAAILSPFAGGSSSKQSPLLASPRSPRPLPKITANEATDSTIVKDLIAYFFTHHETSYFLEKLVILSYSDQQGTECTESLDDGQYGLLLIVLASATWTLDKYNAVFSLSRLGRIELCYIFVNEFQNLHLNGESLESAQAFTLWALLCLMMERSSDAYRAVFIAVSIARALGLHISSIDYPMRDKVWVAIHGVESMICSIMNRPNCIPPDTCAISTDDIFLASYMEEQNLVRRVNLQSQGINSVTYDVVLMYETLLNKQVNKYPIPQVDEIAECIHCIQLSSVRAKLHREHVFSKSTSMNAFIESLWHLAKRFASFRQMIGESFMIQFPMVAFFLLQSIILLYVHSILRKRCEMETASLGPLKGSLVGYLSPHEIELPWCRRALSVMKALEKLELGEITEIDGDLELPNLSVAVGKDKPEQHSDDELLDFAWLNGVDLMDWSEILRSSNLEISK